MRPNPPRPRSDGHDLATPSARLADIGDRHKPGSALGRETVEPPPEPFQLQVKRGEFHRFHAEQRSSPLNLTILRGKRVVIRSFSDETSIWHGRHRRKYDGAGGTELSTAVSARRRFLFAIGILAMLCLICAPLFADRLVTDGPRAHDGYVSFSAWKTWRGPVQLLGDWGLTWHAPAFARGPTPGEVMAVKVPGQWTGVRDRAGAALPQLGSATYQLTINGLKPGEYILFIPTVFHASRVWVNGELVSQMGQVGDTAATTQYLWRAHEIQFRSDGSDVHLAIDEAAFHHHSDGLEATPVLGPVQTMKTWLTLEWSKNYLYYVTLLILSIYGAVVFLFRPDDLSSLYFSLYCMFFFPISLILGHDNLLLTLLPSINFRWMLGIEYTCGILGSLFLFEYTASLFPNESNKFIHRTVEIIFVIFLAIYVGIFSFGDTLLASFYYKYIMLTASIVIFYIIYIVSLAALRGRDLKNRHIFLLGIAAFSSSMMAVIVENNFLPQDKVVGVEFFRDGT